MAVSTGVAPAFSALTRQCLHVFGIETVLGGGVLSGPPRSRTPLRGFGDRPGRWTAALERPAGIAPASPVWKTGALLLS